MITRLNFHSKSTAPGSNISAPILAGMTINQSGEWEVTGEENLPCVRTIDLNVTEFAGKSTASISMLLSTKREQGFVQLTDTPDVSGLIDWLERVFDAIETKPSDGKPDSYLIPHNEDGSLMAIGGTGALLTTEFSLSAKMAQISDLSFTMQLDLAFTPVLTRVANRRSTPIAKL